MLKSSILVLTVLLLAIGQGDGRYNRRYGNRYSNHRRGPYHFIHYMNYYYPPYPRYFTYYHYHPVPPLPYYFNYGQFGGSEPELVSPAKLETSSYPAIQDVESSTETTTPETKIYPAEKSNSENCPPNDPKANKEVMKELRKLVDSGDFLGIEKFYYPNYIQHSPTIADGFKGILEALTYGLLKQTTPERIPVEVQRLSAVDDLVWVHKRIWVQGRWFAAINLFRFKCGLIAEHWDAYQDTTDVVSANPHPFF